MVLIAEFGLGGLRAAYPSRPQLQDRVDGVHYCHSAPKFGLLFGPGGELGE
jgi:hypothetical protein